MSDVCEVFSSYASRFAASQKLCRLREICTDGLKCVLELLHSGSTHAMQEKFTTNKDSTKYKLGETALSFFIQVCSS